MGKFKDLTGQRFEKLCIICRAENTRRGTAQWLCQCDCGNRIVVRGDQIRNGHSQSCGCLQKEITIKNFTIHGKRNTRLYTIWDNMKRRCGNESATEYENYGGRGIFVDDIWINDFQAFYDWSMANGYADDLTIDRIDNDKGYSPDNCKWSTISEQSKNKRVRNNNTSGHAGISLHKRTGKWHAYIWDNQIRIHLGYFSDIKDAIAAREEAETKYWGK